MRTRTARVDASIRVAMRGCCPGRSQAAHVQHPPGRCATLCQNTLQVVDECRTAVRPRRATAASHRARPGVRSLVARMRGELRRLERSPKPGPNPNLAEAIPWRSLFYSRCIARNWLRVFWCDTPRGPHPWCCAALCRGSVHLACDGTPQAAATIRPSPLPSPARPRSHLLNRCDAASAASLPAG